MYHKHLRHKIKMVSLLGTLIFLSTHTNGVHTPMEVARDSLYSMKQEGDSEQKQPGIVMGFT